MQINIHSAIAQTNTFIAVLILTLLLTARKRVSPSFDLSTTNDIKGIAILMVVFAHIGYLLSKDPNFLFPLSVGGGIGVNLFLILSGYGISVSAIKKPLAALQFYKKRIIKLMVPLWVVLSGFLLMDITILKKGYSFTEIWQSYLGYYPVANPIYNIDSPLWFITIILFYYLIYPLIFNKKYLSLIGIILIAVSYLLLFNDTFINLLVSNTIFKRDVLGLYRTHFTAFPLGMILADLSYNQTLPKKIWQQFSEFFNKNKIIKIVVWWIAIFTSIYLAYYTAIYSGVGKGDLKEQNIALITSAAVIFLFIFNKVSFRLFTVLGIYSFEIYLIHWPLLYRYDFFYKIAPPALATSFYIVFLLGLGYLLVKFTDLITARILKIV